MDGVIDGAAGIGSVLGDVLMLALAIAASPFTIIPAILLLLTPRAAATGGSFLVGWLLGLTAVATVAALLASVIEQAEESPVWWSWTRLVLGLVLLAWGVKTWLGRRTPKPTPKWMSAINDATPGRAFRLALILAVANPKVLLLAAAAGMTIGAAELTQGQAVVTIVGFALIASATVIVPLVLYLVLGQRMVRPMSASRDWLDRNNAAVMAVVFVVIGLQLTVKAISELV